MSRPMSSVPNQASERGDRYEFGLPGSALKIASLTPYRVVIGANSTNSTMIAMMTVDTNAPLCLKYRRVAI